MPNYYGRSVALYFRSPVYTHTCTYDKQVTQSVKLIQDRSPRTAGHVLHKHQEQDMRLKDYCVTWRQEKVCTHRIARVSTLHISLSHPAIHLLTPPAIDSANMSIRHPSPESSVPYFTCPVHAIRYMLNNTNTDVDSTAKRQWFSCRY